MQLRKLSAQRFVEVPLFVIPNLFRDLGVDLIQGRVHDLRREVRFFTATSGSSFLSVQRFLHRDAETSSA